MMARAVVVYFLGICLIRFNRRFMSLRTTFNFFLFILMGSILGAAIVGQLEFFITLIVIIFLMLLDYLFTMLVFYFPSIGALVKGNPEILVRDGNIDWSMMKKHLITQDELMEALHRMNATDMHKVRYAYFETDGTITIIL
jgi:uncharacterized membrane protein YcaP (DUF421 family)